MDRIWRAACGVALLVGAVAVAVTANPPDPPPHVRALSVVPHVPGSGWSVVEVVAVPAATSPEPAAVVTPPADPEPAPPPVAAEPPAPQEPVQRLSAPSSGHSDAWWVGVAICEQGRNGEPYNDPFFGYFSIMDGSAGGRPWAEQVQMANGIISRYGDGAWAASCVAAGYRSSPSG